MRTLVIVRSLKMGGMERMAITLADALAEAGHDSHLVTWRDRDQVLFPSHPEVTCHVVPMQRLVRLTGLGLLIELVSRLILNPLIRRSHFVWTGWLGGFVFRAWLNRFERRHGPVDRIIFRGLGTFEGIWRFRDDRARFVLENGFNLKGPSWKQRLLSRCLLDKRHLVGVSEGVVASAHAYCKRYGLKPLSLQKIINACPVQRIQSLMLKEDPEIPSEPFLLNVARLVPQKDHDLLLEAYAQIKPKERLVIIGEGRLKEELQTKAEMLGIADRVTFAGSRKNPYPWMRKARMFVLSSRVEGMGIVLSEALACGTPVISVDCPGGIREILKGELEIGIAEHSADGLARKMRELLAQDGYSIKLEWLQDFSEEAMVARYLSPPPG
ncbi:glycosyltransferase [Halomonas sp. YLGW01]|uniref:glycosyltransferase n=1 Tax=Halomonas sp. YLGW01 TaxID=2773308 RepID=UPI001F5BE1EC|nr:glycosyltransferase [Halomonas sp. YLGW01]